MRKRIIVIAALLCAASPAFGQQLPGIHDKSGQVPENHEGATVRRSAADCEAEVVRLQKLVAEQQRKITLLEAKIDLLQKPASGAEGGTP